MSDIETKMVVIMLGQFLLGVIIAGIWLGGRGAEHADSRTDGASSRRNGRDGTD